jgi:CubicO group peptidase (beta-lactamase class C family)
MAREALFAALAALLPFATLTHATTLECRPPGPVVPPPRSINTETLFTEAADNLTTLMDAAIAGEIVAGWPVENVSFSLALVTWDQPDRAVPAWEYHHLSPNNVRGTTELDRDSQYLIGSISKVVTDYILLKSGVDPDTPVSTFFPGLADETSLIAWGEITLRHLAAQVAGIPPNCMFSSDCGACHGRETLSWINTDLWQMAFRNITSLRTISSL